MDAGDIFNVITIDFRKAFDVVPRNRLVFKLADFGACRQTLLWLAAFLSYRQQRVRLNSRYSAPSSRVTLNLYLLFFVIIIVFFLHILSPQ